MNEINKVEQKTDSPESEQPSAKELRDLRADQEAAGDALKNGEYSFNESEGTASHGDNSAIDEPEDENSELKNKDFSEGEDTEDAPTNTVEKEYPGAGREDQDLKEKSFAENAVSETENSCSNDTDSRDSVENTDGNNGNKTSNEVKKTDVNRALTSFEQSSWEKLSVNEKKEQVSKLSEALSRDLDIKDKPEIRYFSSDKTVEGSYSRSENAIYINENAIDNGKNVTETVAHETRRCWQHERADNPQTEQDYQFKENFEDYVRPEDDFYEYKNQPVEADARDYAKDVKDAIPVSDGTPDIEAKQRYEGNDHKDNFDSPPSTTGPPEKTYQKSELPADFENKNGYQPLNEQAEQKCQLAGMEKDQVQKIREIPNGQKPNPEAYLSKDTIDSHLKKFEDEGCYKVIPGEPVGTVGKGDSLFVCKGSELEQELIEADGDPRKLEATLGMDEGYLGDNPYIVRVDNPKDLRMATGNETNAWQDYWCPGGTTIGGMDEAVVTPPSADDYSFKPCFVDGNSTSIYDENWKKH